MRTKVYVKPTEKQSYGLSALITFIFFFFPLVIFYNLYNGWWKAEYSLNSIMDLFSKNGFEILTCLFFFIISLYMLYGMLKKPVGYRAFLKSKTIENYNGTTIINLVFQCNQEKKSRGFDIRNVYNCYILEEDTSLVVGNEYTIYVKQFNWEIKDYEMLTNEAISTIPNMNVDVVKYGFMFIFGGNTAFILIKMFFDFGNWTNIFYDLIGILICLFFCFSGIFAIEKYKEDNNLKENNIEKLKVKNINVKNIGRRYDNLVISKILYNSLTYLFFVYGIGIIFIFPSLGFSFDTLKNVLVFCSISLVCIEIINLMMMIPYIDLDKKIQKKYDLHISENINLSLIKKMRIFRTISNIYLENYIIIDENRNILYKIQKHGLLGFKYLVCDCNNIKIGEIRKKILEPYLTYIVKIRDEDTFYVRKKYSISFDYEISDYQLKVYGETKALHNTITDNDDRLIANIDSTNNLGYGNADITVSDTAFLSEKIVCICMCITMGNFNIVLRENEKN